MSEKTNRGRTPVVTISGRRFELAPDDVAEAVEGVLPEPVREHYCVVNGQRYPPKQVIGAVTGLDRADFTTHQARRTLLRLGFPAGRQSTRAAASPPRAEDARRGPHGGRRADALRPYIGRWVATAGDDVLVAADSPRDVVAWLSRHARSADSIYRVPESDAAAGGIAPA